MADENTNGIPAASTPAPTPSDDPIERQIDMAIKAMDGDETPIENKDTETKGGDEAPKGDENKSNEQKDSSSNGSNDQSQSNTEQKGAQEQKPAHSPKDLTVKGPNGEDIVVKGGAERRFYEQREVARQQASTYQRQRDEAINRANQAEQQLQQLQETTRNLHGVDPESLRIGARLAQDLQRDPAGTMQKLLAEAVAQGYTIDALTKGVDTAAIQRMIDERLPQKSNEPSEDDIAKEAKQIVDNFYAAHADAKPHDALLGRMMRDNPGLELETAYYELKNAFIEKGFDFSLTLEENLKVSAPNNADPNVQQQTTQQKAPMPNGRAPDGGQMQNADEVKVAHEDTDMGDIVRQAMRESGMKV